MTQPTYQLSPSSSVGGRMELEHILNGKKPHPAKCPYCGLHFREENVDDLISHVVRKHRRLGINACWRCYKVCTSARSLIHHITLRHSEEDSSEFLINSGVVHRRRNRKR